MELHHAGICLSVFSWLPHDVIHVLECAYETPSFFDKGSRDGGDCEDCEGSKGSGDDGRGLDMRGSVLLNRSA